MTKEYVSKMKIDNSINYKGVTLLPHEKGGWAVPGGGRIILAGDADRAAKGLYKSHKGIQSPMGQLADKTVDRLTAASREGVDLVLGA